MRSAAAAPLKGLPSAPRPIAPPVPLTTLVGREHELTDLEPLLRARRVVTLIGAGGTGKTRLALELVRRYPGTVAWVELACLTDTNLIAHQTLSALGGRSGGQTLAIETVLDLLRAGPCLLVLDNCEHLIEGCAMFARAVLHGAETTSILATSREALGVAGEHVWPVPPLSLPAGGKPAVGAACSSSEAVSLFVERARAASPRFKLDERNTASVTEICRRLDGLPLAIELAAARVRALTPDEIARRIADSFKLLASPDRSVDPRHRTLDATIDWSFALLDEDARRLLLRLSVFAGGFTIDDAERVCACEGLPSERVLELLMTLVDRSLVLADPRGETCRYRLLETVRQYGSERLDAAEADEVRERHARAFLALAEEASPHVFGGAASPEWMGRLEDELPNLRVAIDWGLTAPERAEIAQRIGAALHWFWFARGRLREGRRALARAMGMPAGGSDAARARAAIALGLTAIWQGDIEAVRPAMEEGAALLARVEGEDFWRAYGECGLGIAHTLEGDFAGTLPLIDDAIASARRHHHTALLPFALYWRARVLGAMGEVGRGLDDVREAIAASRAQHHRPALAHCLNVEGHLLLAAREDDAAGERLGESLAIHIETGDHWGIARVLEDLAYLARRRGRFERAVAFHGAAERIREAIGTPPSPLEQEMVGAAIAHCRERLSAADLDRAWKEGASLDLAQIAAFARDLEEEGAASVVASAVGDDSSTEVAARQPPRAPEPAPIASAVAASEVQPVLDIRALGATEVRIEGEPVEGLWGRPKELLVLLAWHADGLRREDVGLALWPDASPDKLRNLFHVTLHRLRKSLGKREWVVRDGERYLLTQSIPWQLDARRFEAATETAVRDLRRGGGGLDALVAALALYRGPFLRGESAGDWHFAIKERLETFWLEATRALAKTAAEHGRDDEAGAAYRRLIEQDPVDEDASRALIACAIRRGDRAEALREYRRLERALDDEMGVEPGPEVTALYQQLRRSGGG